MFKGIASDSGAVAFAQGTAIPYPVFVEFVLAFRLLPSPTGTAHSFL